ncbi:restriction endonuclease subunit S [Staphylococcus pseudintermedius]|nr:restriction endonuclease subunit S [Staphylococcus pseudintermedius]EGQ4187126.1 restriction endonuclease subunit S [Staphylococcus pseudintermedius]EHT3656897.1 restriction endonuclease subunit S [Staphylococcus pseudintermedius]EIS6270038.1 restriction endonuclease subunit S [Staphylococcus pseudintermedius]EJG1254605.1 restriction endonuclease subunit S [Staphylococcus pseudintermedius]
MEFKKYKIKDIGEVVTGFTPSKKEKDLYGFTFPFITPSDITNSKYVIPKRFLSEKAISKKEKKVCSKSSVGVSCIGSDLGKAFFIQKVSFTNQQINTITNIKKNFDPEYIYYKIKTLRNYFHRIADGSTMPIINKSKFENLSLDIPSLKNQKKISNILSVLDNKIEINKKIIANLEELSQTLFKHWFVDFEFPDENGNPYKSSGGEMVDSELGMIPKGWEIITINDFANNNVITGKTPSTKIKENYSETGIPFLTIPDMHNDIFALNTERYISELGIEKLIKKVLPKNSLSISCIATPGLVCIIANDTLTNQQINSFTPNKNALYYLYFKLKSMKDYIRDLGSGGSATLNLNKTQFSKIKLVKPINEILYKYDKLVSPNFKMILNIQKEIQQLTQLRDTLLPKLMSGEIEIPDDIEVMEDELSI